MDKNSQLEAQIKNLEKFVIDSNDQILSSLEHESENLQLKIIQKHRTISLISSIRSNGFKYITKNPISKNEMYDFIYHPIIQTTPIIPPLYISKVANFFSKLHSEPINILNSLKLLSLSEMNFLCETSLPSLFGYFSSEEYITLSLSFYSAFITLFQPEYFHIILNPFFSSPCVYRFLESVFLPFFDKFTQETRFDTNQYFLLIQIYSRDIMNLVYSSLPLLPHPHFVLLRIIESRWGGNATFTFFIDWLRDMGLLWLSHLNFSSLEIFLKDVFENIFEESETSNTFLEKLNNCQSNLKLYSLYRDLSFPYLLFMVSAADVKTLYKTVSEVNTNIQNQYKIFETVQIPSEYVFVVQTYPQTLSSSCSNNFLPFLFRPVPLPEINFENEDEQTRFERFLRQIEVDADDPIKAYLKLVENKTIKMEKKFYEYLLIKKIENMNEKGNTFEKIILHQFYLKLLHEWDCISSEHLQLFSAPISLKIAKDCITPDKVINQHLIEQSFKSVSKYFNEKRINQYLFLYIVDIVWPLLIRPLQKFTDMLVTKFESQMENEFSKLKGIHTESHTTSAIIWEVVEQFSSVRKSSLISSAFRKMFRGLNILHQFLGNDENHISLYLQQYVIPASKGQFILTFLACDLVVMGNENFRELCTDDEIYLWAKLHTAVSFVLERVKLYDLYVGFVDNI